MGYPEMGYQILTALLLKGVKLFDLRNIRLNMLNF